MRALKLQVGDEVRRINKAPDNISVVKQIATEKFGIERPGFKYVDEDGDSITILNQEEYLEACSIITGPLKFEVVDSELILLKRSSMLIGPINDDQTSFKCESFDNSSKLSIILHSEGDIKTQEHDVMIQTDDIVYADKEIIGASLVEASVGADLTNDVGVSCEITIDGNQELRNLIRKQLKSCIKEKKIFLGIKCYMCKEDIYDSLFRCTQCSWFYICEECETVDMHSHILIKSRNVVQRLSQPKGNTQQNGNANTLNEKVDLIKKMGFADHVKITEALIKANYNPEIAVEILLSMN